MPKAVIPEAAIPEAAPPEADSLGKVSVLILTHDDADLVEEALESVVAQDVPGLEIVVADDGSTDGTLERIERFAATTASDASITILAETACGPAGALNRGLDQVTGDVVVFFSGAGIMLPDSISERVRILAETGADAVSAPPLQVDEYGRPLIDTGDGSFFPTLRRPSPVDLFRRLFFEGNVVPAAGVAVTRECIEAVGLLDERLWHLYDHDYWLRATAAGRRIALAPGPFSKLRMKPPQPHFHPFMLEREKDIVLRKAGEQVPRSYAEEILFGGPDLGPATPEAAAAFPAMMMLAHSREGLQAAGRHMLERIGRDEKVRSALAEQFF